MLRGAGWKAMLESARELPWIKAVDAILFSHIYFGGWSSLTVRSWMYHLLYVAVAVAAIGLIRAIRRPGVPWLAAVYAAFWAAQLYNVLLLYMSKGLPGSMGWYLYAVIAAEVALFVAGRYVAAIAGLIGFGLLDLYTMHFVAIPYYTGMIRHKPNGALAAFHLSDFEFAALARLAEFKPLAPWILAVLWAASLAATGALVLIVRRRGSV
jgi:hypothetical protein